MPPRLLILSAFANASYAKHLAFLDKELLSLKEIFSTLSYLDYISLGDADRETFTDALLNARECLKILHFGGHAQGSTLFFEDGSGHGPGLAQLLALHPQLKLVFLNACNTQHLARLFAKVPAVLATTNPINDGSAHFFAKEFYKNLSLGMTLENAFKATIAVLEFKTGKQTHYDPIVIRAPIHHHDRIEEVPWRLYVDVDMLDWKLTDLEPLVEDEAFVIRRETIHTTVKQIELLVKQRTYYKAILAINEEKWLKYYPALIPVIKLAQSDLNHHQAMENNLTTNSLMDDRHHENMRNLFQQMINILKGPPKRK